MSCLAFGVTAFCLPELPLSDSNGKICLMRISKFTVESRVERNVPLSASRTPYTTDSVTSDGATIGYRQIGSGPGLILLHGGMQASQHYMRLAAALADAFTVYVPDRRGRGLSGPHGDQYSIAKECED